MKPTPFMTIAPGSRLVMIGDSVTDCNRARPVGEGSADALGDGYVAEINALLMAAHPGQGIRITNMGVSGNTVRDLAARWETDVLALKPDWLSVMIGINDVWRYFDALRQAEAVPPEEFARTFGALLARTHPRLQGLVLMTPYYLEPMKTDLMRRRMDDFGGIVRHLAATHGAILVDTQAAFDRVLAHHPPMVLSADRVHPNRVGHMVLARAFLEAVGFAWTPAPEER
jgi:lysophospholipase L1-like esterase